MDEECKFPRATDATLLQKLHSMHEKNPLYVKSRIGDSKQFGVSHYSGLVAYDVPGFLDKNRDTLQVCLSSYFLPSSSSSILHPNLLNRLQLLLLELCQSSKHELLVQMFADEKEDAGSNSKTTVGGQFKVINLSF